MKYGNTVTGIFKSRPNRFIARVVTDGTEETVHVKNTGRCRELLLPDARVILEVCDNPARKTKYDLIAVYKENLGWVNIDSQVPNKLVREWLESEKSPFRNISFLKPECVYGKSRVDFYLECENRKIFIEVKGCTLEIDGIGYFPDAPTERGVKHLKELAGAVEDGYEAYVAFVIAMPGVKEVLPQGQIHPEFAAAFEKARAAGVGVLNLQCHVNENEIWIK